MGEIQQLNWHGAKTPHHVKFAIQLILCLTATFIADLFDAVLQ